MRVYIQYYVASDLGSVLLPTSTMVRLMRLQTPLLDSEHDSQTIKTVNQMLHPGLILQTISIVFLVIPPYVRSNELIQFIQFILSWAVSR